MFGINFNVTSKDAYAFLAVPVVIGSAVLAGKLALNWWNGKSCMPTLDGAKDLGKKALIVGGTGAAVGLVNSYLTKQPLGQETLKSLGYTLSSVIVLGSVDALTKAPVKTVE